MADYSPLETTPPGQATKLPYTFTTDDGRRAKVYLDSSLKGADDPTVHAAARAEFMKDPEKYTLPDEKSYWNRFTSAAKSAHTAATSFMTQSVADTFGAPQDIYNIVTGGPLPTPGARRLDWAQTFAEHVVPQSPQAQAVAATSLLPGGALRRIVAGGLAAGAAGTVTGDDPVGSILEGVVSSSFGEGLGKTLDTILRYGSKALVRGVQLYDAIHHSKWLSQFPALSRLDAPGTPLFAPKTKEELHRLATGEGLRIIGKEMDKVDEVIGSKLDEIFAQQTAEAGSRTASVAVPGKGAMVQQVPAPPKGIPHPGDPTKTIFSGTKIDPYTGKAVQESAWQRAVQEVRDRFPGNARKVEQAAAAGSSGVDPAATNMAPYTWEEYRAARAVLAGYLRKVDPSGELLGLYNASTEQYAAAKALFPFLAHAFKSKDREAAETVFDTLHLQDKFAEQKEHLAKALGQEAVDELEWVLSRGSNSARRDVYPGHAMHPADPSAPAVSVGPGNARFFSKLQDHPLVQKVFGNQPEFAGAPRPGALPTTHLDTDLARRVALRAAPGGAARRLSPMEVAGALDTLGGMGGVADKAAAGWQRYRAGER